MITIVDDNELSQALRELSRLVDFMTHEMEPGAENVPSALTTAVILKVGVDKVIEYLVRRERDSGASWQTIAVGLGMTRQAAHQRYGHLAELD